MPLLEFDPSITSDGRIWTPLGGWHYADPCIEPPSPPPPVWEVELDDSQCDMPSVDWPQQAPPSSQPPSPPASSHVEEGAAWVHVEDSLECDHVTEESDDLDKENLHFNVFPSFASFTSIDPPARAPLAPFRRQPLPRKPRGLRPAIRPRPDRARSDDTASSSSTWLNTLFPDDVDCVPSSVPEEDMDADDSPPLVNQDVGESKGSEIDCKAELDAMDDGEARAGDDQALHPPRRALAIAGHAQRARMNLARPVYDESGHKECPLTKKHKVPRRCTAEVVLLLRLLLPKPHRFPKNIYRSLKSGGRSERGLSHTAVKFCAQGFVPRTPKRKRKTCDKPTVYYGVDKDKTNCHNCTHVDTRTSYVIPIRKHIQNMWSRDDLRPFLETSFRDYQGVQEPQTDVVHSAAFKEHCGAFVSSAGYRNVVLMLYADGVSVANRRENSMFVISAQVVNLPPDQRRLLSNMLLLQIIPGPKTPSDISGLLQPLVDELKDLYDHGCDIVVGEEPSRTTIKVRAMVLTIVADCRAHPKLTLMKQTPAIYPCHLCELKGETGGHRAPLPAAADMEAEEEEGEGEEQREIPAARPRKRGRRSVPATEEEKKEVRAQAEQARRDVDRIMWSFHAAAASHGSAAEAAAREPRGDEEVDDDGDDVSDGEHADDTVDTSYHHVYHDSDEEEDRNDEEDNGGHVAGPGGSGGPADVPRAALRRGGGTTYSHKPRLSGTMDCDAGVELFKARDHEELKRIGMKQRSHPGDHHGGLSPTSGSSRPLKVEE